MPSAATKTPTVIEALAAVMEEVQAVRKADKNTQQNYNFRGIDAVVNAVGPAFRKHNVVCVPTSVEYATEHYTTKSGTPMRNVTLAVGFRFYGPAGDFIDAQACGEAADSGDKATPKAHSVAYRTLLLQALCIPTDEPDPDAESHERGTSFQAPAGVNGGNGDITPEQKKHLETLTKTLLDGGHITKDQLESASKGAKPAELLARLENYERALVETGKLA